MRVNKLYQVCIPALCLLSITCSQTDSENVTTEGIRATIRAIASGDGNTTIQTELTVGSGGIFSTYVGITGGDSLTATAGGTSTVMVEKKDWFSGEIYYLATFPTETTGTLFTVSFERTKYTSAPNSTVSLPYPPSITAPSPGHIFSQAENITVVWDNLNSSAAIDLHFSLTCTLVNRDNRSFGTTMANLANTGTATYSIISLMPDLTLSSGDTCNMQITASRWQGGSLDPNYGEGGSIAAIQHRQISVTVNP